MNITKAAGILTKKIFFLVLFLSSLSPLFGMALDEEKTIQLALDNSNELKIARQELETAKGLKYEALSLNLPQVYLSASYTRMNISEVGPNQSPYVIGIFLPVMIPAIPTNQSTDLYGAQISAFQNIFTWGKNFWTNEQAKQNYNLAREKMNQAVNDVIFKAKENFYGALLASKLSLIAAESYDLSLKRLEMAKKLYSEGKASKYDLSRTEVVVANAKVAAMNAENAFAVTKEALKSFLDVKEDISLEGEFEAEKIDFDINVIWEKMIESRPEVKQMKYRENIAKSALTASKADNKPRITGGYVYSTQNTTLKSGYDEWQKVWQLGVAFYWPLFDGLLSYGKTKEASANLEIVRSANKSYLEGLKLEVISAYLSFKQAKKSIDVQRENVSLAGENLKIAHKRYSLGLMSSIELQDVQFAFSQAETNYQQALFDYNMAIATLKKVTGEK